MYEQPNNRSQMIFLRLGGIGLLFFLITLGIYQFLIKPTITIDAPNGSSITVRDLRTGEIAAKVSNTSEQISHFRLSPGAYTAVVTSTDRKELFYTSLSLLDNKTMKMDSPHKLSANYVASATAADVVPSGKSITYLDTKLRVITRLSEDGTQTVLNDARSLTTITGDSPGNAFGMHLLANNDAIVQSSGQLFVLHSGNLTPLNHTGQPDSPISILIATNTGQSSFVVAINQTLYWYQTAQSEPKKIMTFPKFVDQLTYGGNKVLAYSTRLPHATTDIKGHYANYAIDPLLIDIATGSSSTYMNGPLTDASLSPDGLLATIETRDIKTVSVYELVNHALKAIIEKPDTTTPQWIDSTRFVYAKGQDIWLFDSVTSTGYAVGSVPTSLSPTSITYITPDSYYATVYDNAATTTIYKLSKTPDSNDLQNAARLNSQSITSSQYRFSYTNITTPILTITTNVVANNLTADTFRQGTINSRQAAVEYLKANSIDPKQLTIRYDPATI